MALRVLYIQHAGGLGGSALSLLYTIQALRGEVEPVVACIRPSKDVLGLYERHGIETIASPSISTFEHTTAAWYRLHSPRESFRLVKQLWAAPRAARATRELVRRVNPGLVHLNSVVLAPSAAALHHAGIPIVWHVREARTSGHFGARAALLRECLLRLPDERIFLSEYDRTTWIGGAVGEVIPNFVDFNKFDSTIDRAAARLRLDLPNDRPIVLYLGGLTRIKGYETLLAAAHRVHQEVPEALFVLPGGELRPSQSLGARAARRLLPLVGSGTPGQLLLERLRRWGLQDSVLLRPFSAATEQYLAASDLVVFPSIVPHFARPVIEAAAMGKPAIGSRLGGVTELIRDNETGLLVTPGSPEELAAAITRLLRNPEEGVALGRRARAEAQARFSADVAAKKLRRVYDRVSGRSAAHARLPS